MNQKRSTTLYPSFNSDYFTDWAFTLPKAYSSALDISLETRMKNKKPYDVWTQGENFSFKSGDVFYDNVSAYTKPWGKALHDLNFSIQITSSESAFGDNPGLLTFDIFHKQKNQLIKIDEFTCSQDDLIVLS